ncbi:MAG TPA: hypothetical protein VNH46_11785 [Gemmatimonadales bacterium]|nr:hypothetical protein [Gemmatimonadales bacterium]
MSTHEPRSQVALDAARAQLVDLLMATLERTFAAQGPEVGLVALREMLSRLDRTALTDLVYQMGLEAEPVREEEDVPGRAR